MSSNEIVLIVIFFVNLILSLFVFSRNSKNPINVIFSLFILCIGTWTLSLALIQVTQAMIWSHVTMISGVCMGTFFLIFSKVFPQGTKKMSFLTSFFFVFPAIIFIILEYFNLVVKGIEVKNGIATPVLGPLYPLFLIYVVIYASYAIISLALKYKGSTGLSRIQLKYLFLGFSTFILAIIVTNVILPVIGVSQLTFLAPAFSLLLIGSILYSIVKHRLMDIRIVLKKTILQILISLTLLIFILGSIFIVAHFFAKRIPDYSLVFTGSFAMVIALLFLNPLHNFFEKLSNKYFFTSLYNYQATLEDLATKLTTVIEMPKVIDLIVDTIMKSMGLDRAGVLLLSNERNANRYLIAKVIGFNEQNGVSLVRDNFLVQWLCDNRKIVVYDELDWMIEESKGNDEKSKLMRLKANMKKIEASLCVPLMSKDKLISIIVLGDKVTGDAYTVEDFRLLQTISNQAVVAIENARLYQQIQQFNKTLEQKVDEQTKEIKDQNVHLQELLKMKSEFLQIASHQLRTPLSAIRGLLSMQADGDFDKLPKKEYKGQQQKMLESANRLSNIVNDLLDAMELEGGYLNFEFVPAALDEMINAIMQELQPNYDKKGLYLKLVQPKEPLPKVEVESKYLREALENFIDNAEKYTNKGGVTVTLSRKNNHAVISITDTGIGIPKTDMPKLFHKFSRGEKSTYQHTDGSGLGLFIAKNIIDEHRGTINIDSPGEGKGTTITVTLPLTQPSLPKNNKKK